VHDLLPQGRAVRTAAFAVTFCAILLAQTATPNPFATHAHFSIDNNEYEGKCCVPAHLSSPLSSVVAAIEAPSGPMGYSWMEIDFYSFRFTQQDIAAARRGDLESIHKKWEAMGENSFPYTDADLAAAKRGDRSAVDRKAKEMEARSKAFNEGFASLQLAIDKDLAVRQVIMNVPGYGCTIAMLDRDLKSFLQQYQFDGKRLRLRSKGSFVCDMKSAGSGTPKFGWDVDLTTPVFPKASGQ
jgi:hypothetical protein